MQNVRYCSSFFVLMYIWCVALFADTPTAPPLKDTSVANTNTELTSVTVKKQKPYHIECLPGWGFKLDLA